MDIGSVNFSPNNTAALKVVIEAKETGKFYCPCKCGLDYHSIDADYCSNCGRKIKMAPDKQHHL